MCSRSFGNIIFFSIITFILNTRNMILGLIDNHDFIFLF